MKTLTEKIVEVRNQICDKYCKYSDRCDRNNEQEVAELFRKHCDKCPVGKL